MKLNIVSPRKALNKAFLKVKPNREGIESFKEKLTHLLSQMNESETEEFHKNAVSSFLSNTYYQPNHYINTKGRNDLVIHNGKDAKSTVGVIIETKKPTNKAEMLKAFAPGDTPEQMLSKINAKAFQELVLYYLRERITHKNLEVKHIIATNIYEWFIFDAAFFDKVFAQNKSLVKQFTDFEEGRLAGTTTDFFYKEIAQPAIADLKGEVEFTYFDIRSYEKALKNTDKQDDNQLISLYKLLSPQHLLKLPFVNDSNSLDKVFYTELLHIIGLTETKEGSKKLIERKKEGERNSGSLLENTIAQLDSLDKLSRLHRPLQFGNTPQERYFNVGLGLVITWVNRILFLKLLEAQLLSYHKGDKSYAFLNLDKVRDFDQLNDLFFAVLAKTPKERQEEVKAQFSKVPYLNSSLFEPTGLEQDTLLISNLRNERTLLLHPQTVLKDSKGKRRSGEMNALEYFFEFLNAYDFSGEGSEEIQEDNKTLINASVLGLIFEKINGYKDGSFFTPGFITMYMCRETIRKAVLQKFNEVKGWKCESIEQLYDKIEDRTEANNIVNSIKICDPAVGSGHFLVSALNEIIAIKNDLKILSDREGKRLKEYHVEVVNDELIVTDEDGKLFEYNPKNKESQRIQETLFHEKQTIIENCLFGVDINPNSVKICRLRLWIELLKNAYYNVESNYTELETLPNIDINIKTGNSLISRFALDSDLKDALKKSKWKIDTYKIAVQTYRNAHSKEEKREMERLINEIKSNFRTEINSKSKELVNLRKWQGELIKLTTQTSLFNLGDKEKTKFNQKVKDLTEDINKQEALIEEIKNNKIFENAFEWRFEFPEVLNDDGDFVGFDVVIGNPPYVFGGNEGITEVEKKYYKTNFENGSGKINLFTLFIEKAFCLIHESSQFGFIIPNTFLRVTSYDSTRRFLVKYSKINSIYDFGDKVFDDAVTTAIVITATKGKFDDFQSVVITDSTVGNLSKQSIIDNDFVIAINHDINSSSLVKKLKANISLGSVCKEMIFGVVITKNKEEIVSNAPKENWKPFIEGKEIGAYYIKEVKQWLNYEPKLLHRARTRAVFESPEKILIQRITGGSKPLKAAYDNQNLYNKESINNIILKENSPVKTKFVLALLNSRLINWFYVNQFTNGSNLTVNLSKTYLSQIPLAMPEHNLEKQFITLVEKILFAKKQNSAADTTALEMQIDQLVYQLYDLTEEEIKIVEGND